MFKPFPIIKARRKLRDDKGPTEQLGPLEEFIELEPGKYWPVAWIKSVLPVVGSGLEIEYASRSLLDSATHKLSVRARKVLMRLRDLGYEYTTELMSIDRPKHCGLSTQNELESWCGHMLFTPKDK